MESYDYANKIIQMSVNLLSTNIVQDIRQKLLKKINKLIAKRAILFANKNHYSLQHLSNMIEETNHQLYMTVQQAKLSGVDITEATTIAIDNRMSISDSKSLLQEPTQVDQNRSQTSSKLMENNRTRRLSLVAKTERSEYDPGKAISYYQANSSFIPLYGQQNRESRQIEAYREMKKRQYEQRAKKQAQQIKNRDRQPINLNNTDVVYDYDCRVTTLQKAKQRKFRSVPQINISTKNQYDEKKKNRRLKQLANRNTAININQKINVTLKEIEIEKEKRKRSHSRAHHTEEAEPMVGLVKVNLQSHKEHEEAINVKTPGVKITIKQRQFNVQKQTNRTALTKITRRLSKSEYLQFKADQQKKSIIKNSHLRFTQKVKPKIEVVKTQVVKEQPKPNLESTPETNYKLSLSLDNKQSGRDHSRVMIHSLLGKAELVREVKHKQYLSEPKQQIKVQRQGLSGIDKYNLLYVKYNGNPPASIYENLTRQLQTQRKQVQKIKQDIMVNSTRKASMMNENRMMLGRRR